MSTLQFIAALSTAVLTSGFLTAIITLWAVRHYRRAETRAKSAEADKHLADAHKTDAEAMGLTAGEFRSALTDLRGAVTALAECITGKARAEAKAEACGMRLEEANFKLQQAEEGKRLLTEQNRERDVLITHLRERLLESGVSAE